MIDRLLNGLWVWFIETGILIEIIGILVIAPLTAALIERRQRSRARKMRRMAIVSLQSHCLSIVQHYTQAFIQLEAALNSEDIDARLIDNTHKNIIEGLRGSFLKKSHLDSRIQALRMSQKYISDYLDTAERSLFDCQRECNRVVEEFRFYGDTFEPEETTVVAELRELVLAVDESCHTFLRSIHSLRRFESIGGLLLCDFASMFEKVKSLVAIFGLSKKNESWLMKGFDAIITKLSGVPAVADLYPAEVLHLQKISERLLENELLFVSLERQEKVAMSLRSAKLLKRYPAMIDELLADADKAKPDDETQ